MDTLFELQKYRLLINFNNNIIMAGVNISDITKEENIAIQQAPLDNAIFAKTQRSALDFNNPNSNCSLLAEIVALGPYIGPQVSKYMQTTQ